MEVHLVRTEEQAAHVRVLAWEFVDWLRERYPEMHGEIDGYLRDQNFNQQLDGLLTYFSPPKAECLLAIENDIPLGIVMLKPNAENVCEMNRMFVRSAARGKGVAHALCRLLISRAKELGYRAMVLTAGDNHVEAIALYESLGFLADDRPPDTTFGNAREVRMRMDF